MGMSRALKNSVHAKLHTASFIIRAAKPFYYQIFLMLIIGCYSATYVSLQPYVIKLILDNLNENALKKDLIIPIILYCLLTLSFTIVFRFHDYISMQLYPKLKAKIVSETMANLNHYPQKFFQEQFSGSLANKIKDLSNGTADIIQILISHFFSATLTLIIACYALIKINPLLSLILITWTLISLSISFLTTHKAKANSFHFAEANSNLLGTMVDNITNVLSIRLFTTYKYEQEKLDSKIENVIQEEKKLRGYLLRTMTFQGLSTTVMISTCLWVLCCSFAKNHATIGDFGLVLTLTLSFVDIIWQFSQHISQFIETYGLVIQGVNLLSARSPNNTHLTKKKLCIVKGEILFKNVSFQYTNTQPLFNNLNITICGGQKVGLVGHSGSGKSTFLNLILHLATINQGSILIDNQDISKIQESSLHRTITLIPQEPILFHRTLMENIRYGRLNATDKEVIDASKSACADDFIAVLPEGYATLVGERGLKLSGGERQRIAIARAILKNSPIFLLDEATSALDTITEKSIKQNLHKFIQDKTAVVIAHRLSTLLQMDRILVFEKGKIVEDGTHSELMKLNGIYRNLWNSQKYTLKHDTQKNFANA